MKRSDEVQVVSKNAFSKLKLSQFILAIIFIIGVVGFFIDKPNKLFSIMLIVGALGIYVMGVLRWLLKDV